MVYDVIIVGAGPAGSSAAIKLSSSGFKTLLLEQKHMPREKLCGEFVTPEAFPTLRRLGVMDDLLSAGAERLTSISLNAENGRRATTPVADVSNVDDWVLSLSRAKFDQILFDQARKGGTTCLEGFSVSRCHQEGMHTLVTGIKIPEGEEKTFKASVVIDASGRSSRFSVRNDERRGGVGGKRVYALKSHFRNVEGIANGVELYFFPGGYGGLSRIEDGLFNLCFTVSEQVLKDCGGVPDKVLQNSLFLNPLAKRRLAPAVTTGSWLAVGPLSFGHKRYANDNVISVGDALGMIDPFTGTGIQIAVRSGEILSETIVDEGQPGRMGNKRAILELYARRCKHEFGHRHRIAGILRHIAFSKTATNLLGRILTARKDLATRLVRTTRSF